MPSIDLRSLNLCQPDHTVEIKNQRRDLADVLYEPEDDHPREFFLVPSTAENPLDLHHFVSCHRNLVRVYSITGKEGIQLKSEFSIPDFAKNDKLPFINKLKRKFLLKRKKNKLIIVTGKPQNEQGDDRILEFQELDFGQDSANQKIVHLQSKEIEDKDSIERLLIPESSSYRVYIRNSVLEVGHLLTVTQSYTTANQKVPRPITLSRHPHTNLKEILIEEGNLIEEEEASELHKALIKRSINSAKYWERRVSNLCKATIKDISKRFYSVNFDIFRYMTVVKVYDKIQRRLVKVTSILPYKIIDEAFKQNNLFSALNMSRNLKNDKITDFNLFEDRVEIEGEILREGGDYSNPEDFSKFKIVAFNCLVKKKDQKYLFELLGPKHQLMKKTCLGDCFYLIKKDKKKDNLVINIYKKFKKRAPKKPTKKVILDKKADPLLKRLTKVEEVGVVDNQNLIYMRDQRFLYLIDVFSGSVRQRVRYSSWKETLPLSNYKFLNRLENPPVLNSNLFAKVDPNILDLEFFRIQNGALVDLGDLNLKELIEKSLNAEGLTLDFYNLVRFGESKSSETISLYTHLAAKPLDKAIRTNEHGGYRQTKFFMSVQKITKNTLKQFSSVLVPWPEEAIKS